VAYVDDMYLLGDNKDTIIKNTETLIDFSMKVGLEVNVEKLNVCWCLVTRMQTNIWV
jgi:hypothetical protein